MKPTDFSKSLTDFLSLYLPGEKGFSHNTIASYKDTFILFLRFMKERKIIEANYLTLKQVDQETVLEFLDWLEKGRGCSNATRNARLAAIHSFFRYLQYRHPAQLYEWQRILAIPIKRIAKPVMSYITLDGIKLLLMQPDQSTAKGKRDLALLSLMYDSGARVQEMIDLTPACINFNRPYTIKLTGKGNKQRIVPLMEKQVELLRDYMAGNKLLEPYAGKYPMFSNGRMGKFTRMGITLILKKYALKARNSDPTLLPENITPHHLRHSKAMHLLQSGVNLVYIRDFLGHSSISTTEIYARADSKLKREALEKAYINVVDKQTQGSPWLEDAELLDWLKRLK